jgi:AsmA protein
MKKILIVAGSLIGLVVVAAIAVPLLIPTDTWKNQIEQRASAATGRKLTIAGPVQFSLLPTFAVVANNVTFANAPGSKNPVMASLAKLEVQVRVLPLLSGRLAVERFVIDRPVIHLEVNAQGKGNWDLSTASTASPTANKEKQGGGAPENIELGDVRLNNGTVTYDDARDATHYQVDTLNARVLLPSLDGPLKFDGSLAFAGQKVAVTGEISQPNAAMSGKGSNIGFTIDAESLNMEFSGKASGKGPDKLDGNLSLDVPSVRGLASWLGQDLDLPGSGYGPLSIKGTLSASPDHYSFTDATYKLDAIEANGDLTVDTSGKVPYAKATLVTGMLDLNPYLPEDKRPGTGGRGGLQGPAAAATPAERASQGWSTEKIDLSPLKVVNEDLSLTVGGLRWHALNTGKSVLNVSIRDAKLTADMPELAFYDGNGKAHIVVDGSTVPPQMAVSSTFTNIDIYPLLKDAISLESISGKATGNVTLGTSGDSQRDLVSALNGKGAATVKDGAVSGLDIGAMITNIGSAFSAASSGKEQHTGFSDASMTFNIVNGVAKNDDLSMAAPLFRVAGKGTVDMPKRTIAYRIEPKLVPDPRGQGGWKDAIGIGVPVDIKGPWNKISYQPDLLGALPSASGALNTLRSLFGGGSK